MNFIRTAQKSRPLMIIAELIVLAGAGLMIFGVRTGSGHWCPVTDQEQENETPRIAGTHTVEADLGLAV